MQDLILIFSRCEKKRNGLYQFHFKGFYSGIKIKKLVVSSPVLDALEVDSDYLLWTQKIDIIHGILRVKLIKYKKII